MPDKKLAPPNGTPERTELQQWLNFVSSELHKGFSPLFNPAMPEEAKKIFRDRLGTRFAHVDKHLAGNDYLLGKEFSVADAYLFTISNWAPASTSTSARTPTCWPTASASAPGPPCRRRSRRRG